MKEKETSMEDIVSLAKRRGFIFQGSEIYGGLAGTWDYGPYGVALKNNIKNLWWDMFVSNRDDVYGLDSAILMNERVWEVSGHTGAGFTDSLVECEKCKKRFREDTLEDSSTCPECKNSLSEKKDFNLMFETKVGAGGDSKSYLRPETAQGIFVNFKNVIDSLNPKLPFGIAQIGKAFRNEISPRDFVFRTREFEQMEVEYFVHKSDWEKQFEEWRQALHQYISAVGIDTARVSELEVSEEERAHYSTRTIDFEFDFPFGKKELYGLAYRTDHDLSAHRNASGTDLRYMDSETNEKFVPHVIEPSLGVDRTVLAVLVSAYDEDELGGEKRVVMRFSPRIAPVKVAVFPLLKNKPELVGKAREVYSSIKEYIPQNLWDDNGNIGKRYRRQDEIGTPYCITVDFDTLENDTVTIRDRDSGEQERIALDALQETLSEKLST